MIKSIQPTYKPVIVQGRLIYDSRSQAFSIIRFKKRILEEFSQLRKDKQWRYQMEYWSDYDLTMDRIMQIYRRDGTMPIMVFIYPEDAR